MAYTVQNILDLAVGRSSLNSASLVSTNEVLRWVGLQQRKIYLLAAQLSPEYFGKSADTTTRSLNSSSWDIASVPGDVAAVFNAKVAAIVGGVAGVSVGTVINLVAGRWTEMHVSPRAFLRGQKLVPVGTDLGTSDANMVTRVTLDYAELPAQPTAMGNTVRLPEEWAALLEIPLARILALRDQRGDELPLLDAEYTEWLALLQNAVKVYDAGAFRPVQSFASMPVPSGGR